MAVILAVAAGSAGILERFTNISFGASTFLGRILYVQDALPLILKHPFGLGYYGYYFIQQSVQTGVYTVVNAHNELIQILLDVRNPAHNRKRRCRRPGQTYNRSG